MTVDEILEIADQVYPDGIIGLYAADPDGEHGDTLAQFIVREISQTYDESMTDEEQLYEAERVMHTAADEVSAVQQALLDAYYNAQETICPKCHQITKARESCGCRATNG